MKTHPLIFRIFMILALAAAITTGCRKKEKTTDDKDTQSAQDNEQSEGVSNDVANMADAAAAGVGSFRLASGQDVDGIMSGCATVTRDTIAHTITIDFGTSNCLCMDNRYRRGIINITYTQQWFTAGSTRTVTFNNYYVNDHKIEGTHSVTFNGPVGPSGHYTWTINAQNMKITKPDGRFHTWNSLRTREMIAGDSTPLNRSDDIYLITGSADGVNINGVAYTATIQTALRREVGCRWFVSGTVEIVPQGRPARTLDFGSGTCDANATVTINGTAHPITLH